MPFCRVALHLLRLQHARHAHARDRRPVHRVGAGASTRSIAAASTSSGFEIGELHLGGGTPTFLTVEELDLLLDGLLGASRLRGDAALSVEADPRVTTREQLELMARHGFRRVSLGVQDFDPRVQDIVNRVQSEEQVRAVTRACARRSATTASTTT